MSYYYLVASLPALRLGGPPPLAPAQFRVLCSEHLEPDHLVELDAVLAGAGSSTFARGWRRHELTIRSAAARLRAARRGLEETRFVRPEDGHDLTTAGRVRDALAAADPRARERALDELRFAAAAELAFSAPFALAAVLAYAVQLDLCARWAARSPAAGQARLLAQVAATLQQFARQGGAS